MWSRTFWNEWDNRCKMKSIKLFFVLVIVFILALSSSFVLAHTDETEETNELLPENVQKLIEYKHEQADFYLRNLSFLVAFLAGILGILTPCSLAILPAFFAYSFESKKEITKMTSVFFLGFAPVFIIFGLIATLLGKSLAMFQKSNQFLVIGAGIFLIIFGLMVLFGKGFSGISFNKKTKKTPFGVFLFGILFAIGFTACMGPILVGILLIASTFQNYFYSGFLMLFYSLGFFIPLFLISMSFDKFNFAEVVERWNKKVGFPISSLIAGILLIAMGITFIILGGTHFFDFLGLGSLTVLIYNLQEKLFNLKFLNTIAVIILGGFVFLMWKFLKTPKSMPKNILEKNINENKNEK